MSHTDLPQMHWRCGDVAIEQREHRLHPTAICGEAAQHDAVLRFPESEQVLFR